MRFRGQAKKLLTWHCKIASLYFFIRVFSTMISSLASYEDITGMPAGQVKIILNETLYELRNVSIPYAKDVDYLHSSDNETRVIYGRRGTPHLYGPPVVTKIVSKETQLNLQKQYEKLYYSGMPQLYSLDKVNTFNHNIVMKPVTQCSRDTFMIILVHSRTDYFDTRQAIRETWGSIATGAKWPVNYESFEMPKVKLVFMTAIYNESMYQDKLIEEHEEFDDIVQGDFQDSYVNMTLKSLLGLKYVFRECPHAKYMLKSDDDMFLNLPHIVTMLQNPLRKRTILGPMNPKSRIDRTGLWGVDIEIFPYDMFPLYASGSAYIISGDMVEHLYEAAEYVPWFHVDDAFITGVLPKVIGNVKHERKPGFAFWGTKLATACKIVKKSVYTSTKMFNDLKYKMWNEIKAVKC